MDGVRLRGGNEKEIRERWEGTGGDPVWRELDLVNEERRYGGR